MNSVFSFQIIAQKSTCQLGCEMDHVLQFRRLQPIIGSARTSDQKSKRIIRVKPEHDLFRIPKELHFDMNTRTQSRSRSTQHQEKSYSFNIFKTNTVQRRVRYRFIDTPDQDTPVTYSNIRKQPSLYTRPKALLSLNFLPGLNL
jgi:hypothetical protein